MSANLEPAARELGELVRNVRDDQLHAKTPCPEYSLGDLLDHVGGLALAFTMAANKATPAAGGGAPAGDASRLGDDWRDRIPRDLLTMADAWRAPGAWTGMTRVGGLDLPGEIAGLVGLDELVVHGWDVARASAQPFASDNASLDAVHAFVAPFAAAGQEASGNGPFGPVVAVPGDAPLLDRVLGLTGRDPAWSA